MAFALHSFLYYMDLLFNKVANILYLYKLYSKHVLLYKKNNEIVLMSKVNWKLKAVLHFMDTIIQVKHILDEVCGLSCGWLDVLSFTFVHKLIFPLIPGLYDEFVNWLQIGTQTINAS